MSEPGERPRWSFTWLLRIQRTGRNRREGVGGADQTVTPRLRRWIIVAIIGGIVLAEVIFGIWLGILPR
jgi:hypothetical protein